MGFYIKLTETQAHVIREAQQTQQARGTMTRTGWKRGANIRTYRRLFQLGLIAAPEEYAFLTDMGVEAHRHLNSHETSRTVQTGPQTRTAHLVVDAPVDDGTRYSVTVVTGDDRIDTFTVIDRTKDTLVAVWTVNNPDGYTIDSVVEARGWKLTDNRHRYTPDGRLWAYVAKITGCGIGCGDGEHVFGCLFG